MAERKAPDRSTALASWWQEHDFLMHLQKVKAQKALIDNSPPYALRTARSARAKDAKGAYYKDLRQDAIDKENTRLLHELSKIITADKRFSRAPFGGSNLASPLLRASLGQGFVAQQFAGIRLDENQVPFLDTRYPHVSGNVALMLQEVERHPDRVMQRLQAWQQQQEQQGVHEPVASGSTPRLSQTGEEEKRRLQARLTRIRTSYGGHAPEEEGETSGRHGEEDYQAGTEAYLARELSLSELAEGAEGEREGQTRGRNDGEVDPDEGCYSSEDGEHAPGGVPAPTAAAAGGAGVARTAAHARLSPQMRGVAEEAMQRCRSLGSDERFLLSKLASKRHADLQRERPQSSPAMRFGSSSSLCAPGSAAAGSSRGACASAGAPLRATSTAAARRVQSAGPGAEVQRWGSAASRLGSGRASGKSAAGGGGGGGGGGEAGSPKTGWAAQLPAGKPVQEQLRALMEGRSPGSSLRPASSMH